MVYFAKWKVVLVIAVCLFGLAFTAPNFLSREQAESLPAWIPHQQISLGLDLQGGAHLLLEVEVDNVLVERMDSLVDAVRGELRKARIRYKGLGLVGLDARVRIVDAAKVEQAWELIRKLDSDVLFQTGNNGLITMTLSDQAKKVRRVAALEQSIEIIRRRIDETGVREPTVQRQGNDRILLQMPGIDDPERVKIIIGKTAKLNFHLVDQQASVSEAMAGRVPPGSKLLPSVDEKNADGTPRMYLIKKRAMVRGQSVVHATGSFDGRTNEPVVNFRFDAAGGKRFGDVTTKNVNRLFAIVLDDEVISAPVIREPILGGSGQISGSFTVESANDLALLIRAGALPAKINFLEERSVGPGLGADSIEAGKFASIIGMILVVGFMAVAYGRFGIMADIALVFNMILIMGALSILQATLTLPGIAGIVLTIGMAVDANVLIFERIREETRSGRTPISAVDAGYSQALRTIIDANVTTLIAAILLYAFGSGPIRGFAVTLGIGIVTSMFTAIMLTRLMVVSWLRKSKPKELPI